jgi:hypothetical protein
VSDTVCAQKCCGLKPCGVTAIELCGVILSSKLAQTSVCLECGCTCCAVLCCAQRIRAGKELLEAKRKEEDGAMRRLVEERKREKEEEARARCVGGGIMTLQLGKPGRFQWPEPACSRTCADLDRVQADDLAGGQKAELVGA